MTGRFVILREAGGIGDVVRTFPVARGLKETHPGARVDYCCLAGYEGLVGLSPDVDLVFTVTERERRPRDATPSPEAFPYLRRFAPGCELVDLYCPAYRHEVQTEGAVTLDRVEIFCRAGDVAPSTPRIVVPQAATVLARAKLRRFFGPHVHHGGTETRRTTQRTEGTLRSWCAGRRSSRSNRHHPCLPAGKAPRPCQAFPPFSVSPRLRGVRIGLAPYATHVSRSLPSRRQVLELAGALRGAGARLVFFHSWRCARPGRDEVRPAEIGAYPALKLGWAELAATVAACDLVVSVDTGIFHLAGALGVPTVGLFGPTSGEIICRPYPTHTWITAAERPPLCDPPCYGRPARGYAREVCGRAGCEAMRSIAVEAVTERRTGSPPAPI